MRAVKEEECCAYCGTDLDGAAPAPRRFGEPFCSDAHADAFAEEARAARIERATSSDPTSALAAGGGPASSRWDLKRTLKMAACCGLPLLALVFLAGGGGALLGAGAAVLPLLAVLACPLGMFFMMRAMQGHGKGDSHTGADRPSPSKEMKER
ncbi:MAG: DUF2933 domain-containing protein [Candidatus Rokuibacteriota bacterium]